MSKPKDKNDNPAASEESIPTASFGDSSLSPGAHIGPYKLLSILGEGGFAVVYLAEQERPVKRRVALKIIKPGMDSKQVIARFEAERQALALLDHPNVAHVYDAGTTALGRPYFVMEYVKGVPITEHCDRHNMTVEERLKLFLQVCEAVQHAHQKSIIHRDIKPSNILVLFEDQQSLVKVIDFGIAKAISQPLTERTLYTEQGQLVGTPEYMSPEQAEMTIQDIDTRSDIYSLGVVLYELLSGILPFESQELRKGGIEHIRTVIREQEPGTPSVRLDRLTHEQTTTLAKHRHIELSALKRELRGDLDWITLKAMDKDRTRRYGSAGELAADIQRHLNHEPVVASPPSTVYRLKKFIRRNRAVVTSIAAVLIVLLAGIIVSSIFAFETDRARQEAVVAQKNEAILRQQAEARELATRRLAYASDMSLAQHALGMNDLGHARRLLDAYRPDSGQVDLRGWEWRYLWQECQTDALGELYHYPKSAYSVAYSTNGEMLAVAGTVQDFVDIWDINRGRRITILQPEEGHLVAFSPRGDLLATDDGKNIQLWQTGIWKQVSQQLNLSGNISVLKFSPDGNRLASLSFPNELTVWEVDQWIIVRQVQGVRLFGTHIGQFDFSPDGKALVTGDADGQLQVIDLAGENKNSWQAHAEGITSVVWSPDGSIIASGSGYTGGPIRLWDAASGQSLGVLEGHTSWISELIFSADGLRLYSASGDQTIRIWDVERQQCLATLRGSTDEVYGLALSPEGTTLASAAKNGIVAFWNAHPSPEEEQPRVIPLGGWPAFAPDGRLFATPQNGTVRLYDLATSKQIDHIPELGSDVRIVVYSPDGRLLVSGSQMGRIRVWSCAERRLVREIGDSNAPIKFSAFRGDGTRLLSIDSERNAVWWDTLTWQQMRTFVIELESVSETALSPNGSLLAIGNNTGAVRWFNAETGELMDSTSTAHKDFVVGIAFSADGTQAASVAEDGTLAFWDPSSFQLIDAFKAHMLGVHGVAFSPDGRRLVTGGGSSHESVKLWDMSTHRELMTLAGQGSLFSFVAFSPDGQWLAARSGKLHLWRAQSWEEIEAAEKQIESRQLP